MPPRCGSYVVIFLGMYLPVAAGWSIGINSAQSPLTSSKTKGEARAKHGSFLRQRLPEDIGNLATEPEISPVWLRSVLAAVAMCAVVIAGVPRSARAAGDVDVYFGQGCFWHVQHEYVVKEQNDLGRKPAELTALAGYAGGTSIGPNGEVCYHNGAGKPDYGRMGHTEVVGVKVPEGKVGDFTNILIDSAMKYNLGRSDPQDRGPEYRSAIGLPGGLDSPLFKQIVDVNKGRVEFVRGEGNDNDTLGTKKMWVYDSVKFPFYQGEIKHQYRDDMVEKYGETYAKLKDDVMNAGTIKKVDCPEARLG